MLKTIFDMDLAKIRRWLAPPPTRDDLYPAVLMRIILERERTRADRTRIPLSVITFQVDGQNLAPDTAARLGKILRSRLRTLDETGWLDDGRICAILPATPPQGAWKVAEDVRGKLPTNVPPPICTVYAYPDDLVSNGQDTTPETAGKAAPLSLLLMQSLPVWKRVLDVCGAAIGLVLLVPLLAMIAAAIKLSSNGPVFFRQRRSGHGGSSFVLYKFRTMVVDAEARKAELQTLNERDGPAFKMKNDPRVTRLGRFLRTTSLDELPQLWNVLKGDMSLVGPRPLPCAEADGCTSWQRQRLDVMPGLTCIWQVEGRGGVSFADWIRMDVRYIRSRSPWYDFKLLLLTIPAVVLRRGAH